MSERAPTVEERARKVVPCLCDPEKFALPCWEGEDDRDAFCRNCLLSELITDEIRAAGVEALREQRAWMREVIGTVTRPSTAEEMALRRDLLESIDAREQEQGDG